jgi:hypothetical protein
MYYITMDIYLGEVLLKLYRASKWVDRDYSFGTAVAVSLFTYTQG